MGQPLIVTYYYQVMYSNLFCSPQSRRWRTPGLEAVDADHLLADTELPAGVYDQLDTPPFESAASAVDLSSASVTVRLTRG
jgi:hypothetical protein